MADEQQTSKRLVIETVGIGIMTPDGKDITVDVPLDDLAGTYLVIKAVGAVNAGRVWNFALRISQALVKSGVENPEVSLVSTFRLIESLPTIENSEDIALGLSYGLLREKKINRQQAHLIATSLLGDVGDVNAWRKRVDRYAERHKLPPAGKKGRPAKQKNGRP